jgi:hypothetical protein
MPALPSLTELLTLRRGLGIVHHVPGRIRLRLGPVIWDWAQGLGLDSTKASAWLSEAGLGAVTWSSETRGAIQLTPDPSAAKSRRTG